MTDAAELSEQLVAGEQISRLIADPLSEAPATVPALRRFNIYQELCFGLLYRGLQFFPGTLMSPATFYCLCVFVVYGFGLLAFFSMLGSAAEVVLAGALYVSGLEECTHVAFMPPLRENCAMTFWFVSLWALQDLHKKQAKADFALTAGLCFLLSVTMFVLLWQFACFALLLQAFALYAMLLLGLLEASFVAWASRLHACGTLLASLLRLGDTWPLRSPFFSLAVAFSMCKGRCSAVLCGGLALLLHRLVACEDDAHIQDFLRYRLQAILHTVGDKPPPVASYHAALYAGQRSFSSPQLAELRRPLLYAGLLGIASFRPRFEHQLQSLLALATAPLYLLMMRYQMLFFPQMVLLGGSCATFLPPWLRLPLAMGVFALSEGSVPWRGQASAFLEDKVERDVLMSWIRNYTAPEDVIISGMGVSALVRLHALRGIVCHPHYESAQLRERCFWADKLHGHRTLEEYHAIIRQRLLPGFNGRAFVAVSVKDCFSVNEAGQVVSGLVEVDEPWRRTRPKTCDLLYQLAAKKGLGFQPRWLGRWFALLEFLPGGVGQPLQFSQATRCAFGRYLYEEKGDAMAAEHFQKIGQSWRKLAPACGCAAELFGPAQDIHIAHSWAVEEERRGFGCCPMSPKFSTCLSDKAFRLLRQGQSPALAELYFQKAAELAPSSPKAHGFLGFARLQAGMALEAQQSFQRALQLEETPTDTTKCGEALSRVSLGQLAGARLALKELPSCRQHLQGVTLFDEEPEQSQGSYEELQDAWAAATVDWKRFLERAERLVQERPTGGTRVLFLGRQKHVPSVLQSLKTLREASQPLPVLARAPGSGPTVPAVTALQQIFGKFKKLAGYECTGHGTQSCQTSDSLAGRPQATSASVRVPSEARGEFGRGEARRHEPAFPSNLSGPSHFADLIQKWQQAHPRRAANTLLVECPLAGGRQQVPGSSSRRKTRGVRWQAVSEAALTLAPRDAAVAS